MPPGINTSTSNGLQRDILGWIWCPLDLQKPLSFLCQYLAHLWLAEHSLSPFDFSGILQGKNSWYTGTSPPTSGFNWHLLQSTYVREKTLQTPNSITFPFRFSPIVTSPTEWLLRHCDQASSWCFVPVYFLDVAVFPSFCFVVYLIYN